MSTLDLDITPNYVVMNLIGQTGVFSSPMTGSIQTVDRGGFRWQLMYTYTALRNDDRANVLGTLAALRSQANRLRMKVYDNPRRGSYGGNPLVMGGSQSGSSIVIDGCSISVTNWIRKGDYFSINVNGEHELKMCTADANSNGSGQCTISFEPRLRASPLNNAVVFVQDGGGDIPQGVFILNAPQIQWSSRPGLGSKTTAVTIDAVEDMFVTQA